MVRSVSPKEKNRGSQVRQRMEKTMALIECRLGPPSLPEVMDFLLHGSVYISFEKSESVEMA